MCAGDLCNCTTHETPAPTERSGGEATNSKTIKIQLFLLSQIVSQPEGRETLLDRNIYFKEQQ